jgi:hypothetical protein
MGKNNINREDLNKQIASMKSRYPEFTHCVRSGVLSFTGDLMILPKLPIYNITITYNGSRIPKIIVNSPKLVENPPHTFSDNSLCLFHRSNYNWTKDCLIAKNIVGWTAAWIFFYEYWLQTGTWAGPEVSHGNNEDKQND